jgi:hypothetical protein
MPGERVDRSFKTVQGGFNLLETIEQFHKHRRICRGDRLRTDDTSLCHASSIE